MRKTFGDCQFSGTIQAQSGRPPSGAVSRNLDQAGVGPGSGNQYYIHTGTPSQPHKFGSTGGAQWFESDVFKPAPVGTFAPRGARNLVYGPGFQSFNSALHKSFAIIPGHENHQLACKPQPLNYPT